jgi:hypothetical protein
LRAAAADSGRSAHGGAPVLARRGDATHTTNEDGHDDELLTVAQLHAQLALNEAC